MNFARRLAAVLLAAVTFGCHAAPEPDTFDQSRAAALTQERRTALDVAFFNEFVVKGQMPRGMWESGAAHPGGARIHAMAEEGFEVAWLAERLFDFHRGGFPRSSPEGIHYWNRLKALAVAGDASAQCLIWRAAPELNKFGGAFVPEEDVKVARYQFVEKAAAQGHPLCSGDWGNYHYQDDPERRAELNLYGARKGCLECQFRASGYYLDGSGVQADLSKAWCWTLEAKSLSDSVEAERYLRIRRGFITGNLRQPLEQLTHYRPGSNCEEPLSGTVSSTQSTKGE